MTLKMTLTNAVTLNTDSLVYPLYFYISGTVTIKIGNFVSDINIDEWNIPVVTKC